ncbi:MAG TPA: ferritin-like domain-containing protein [Tepidisphaeraceae bacterium]|jgi:ferritin-like metal-binding protein YciE|nr:ferritin-like domain-containing protein [Tepidisphaeraceae bacterium]
MALLSYEFNNLNDLFLNQLEDLYDAEIRITDALPKMADAASSQELKSAFKHHLEQTRGHARRLEQIFNRLGKEPQRETCEAMKGLIREGSEMISAKGNPAVHDAALIAAAQRVEHYEMAGYGTVRTFAQQLGLNDVATTLQQTLDEEGQTDKLLTQIAEHNVNVSAPSAAVQ